MVTMIEVNQDSTPFLPVGAPSVVSIARVAKAVTAHASALANTLRRHGIR
jgi:hypothetical protein